MYMPKKTRAAHVHTVRIVCPHCADLGALAGRVECIIAMIEHLACKVESIGRKGARIMGKAEDILAAVEAQSTVVDSVLTLVEELASADIIAPDVAQRILDTIASDRAKLEAALLANTPQRPADQPEGFAGTGDSSAS